ncbi:sugar ABC transporter ATP-binding protein [Marinomonas sp. MED121]|uniref:sugar ABC transporter ATP-binding protein n=1 Tax=Marinomonas sp. MED121 TaxID=314277 RepID=UPI000068FB87|nr:sugar ABC transporter ATP-binding protein [Marinomonas sp. MED121]EAQ65113.1 sugar ABC transporter ATP-binding protein [Marinomonas sp. MED121]
MAIQESTPSALEACPTELGPHSHSSQMKHGQSNRIQNINTNNEKVQPLLKLDRISKLYPGVVALDKMQLTIMPGEVHILFGENGAGKSTLISTIAGAHQASSGDMYFAGEKVLLHSVQEARKLGISAVFQEFSLVPQLSIAENLFLGAEPLRAGLLDQTANLTAAKALLSKLGFELDAEQKVAYLSRAEQQMVEIAKAFRTEPKILILDEPTASLTEKESDRLFELVSQLKAKGVGIIYITHRMSEIRRIGDRITIMRDGKYISTLNVKDTSEDALLTLMTGRVIDKVFPKVAFHPTSTALSINNLSTKDNSLKKVSIEVKRGEIVGLAGLIGSGKSELLRACFGLEPLASGSVHFNGEEVTGFSPKQMLDRGFFYNSADRKNEGLAMNRSCRENITLASLTTQRFSLGLFLKRFKELKECKDLAKKLQLQPFNIEREVENFSGGNQQKVLLAKCLTRDVSLYVFDEPTVGVDVGTRTEIYQLIANLCESGAAVVLISSDLPEIIHLSHRAYVMYRGELKAELSGTNINEQMLLNHFFERECTL